MIAWDNHGRAFFGSESSDDPAGTPKTFGDSLRRALRQPGRPERGHTPDGLKYDGTTVVAKGSSAPNLLGKFNDKTAIEADRTGGRCDGNVYFSCSRFTGNNGVSIYFSRSTDHGVTFSQPATTPLDHEDLQFPDISVTGSGTVYVTFRQFAATAAATDVDTSRSRPNCGQTFSPAQVLTTFTRSDAEDVRDRT